MVKIVILLCLGTFCCAQEEKTAIAMKEIYFLHRIPIAIIARNFTEFIFTSQIFSDQSLLIKEVIEEPSKMVIITCPGLWGKSINLHMIRTFFMINADDHGNRIMPIESNANYRIFVFGEVTVRKRNESDFKHRFSNSTAYLEDPLLIAKHPGIIEKHICQYPVIYVEFCVTSSAKSFQELVRRFKKSLVSTFDDHKYMTNVFNATLNSNISDENAKQEARYGLKLFRGFANAPDELNLNDVIDSLNFLSKTLHGHFNKSVYVLIDDYDIPWSTMLVRDWSTKQGVADFLYIYSAFIDATINRNNFLEKAILTGKLAPPTDLRRLAFKQITECSPLTGKWMHYYGITPPLVKRILNESSIPENYCTPVPIWYNGFKMNRINVTFYHPASIAYYMTDYQRPRMVMKPRWVFGTNNAATFIDNCLRVELARDKLRCLIYRQNVPIKYIRQFTYRQLQYLHQVWRVTDYTMRDDPEFTDQAIMFLYTMGYLTLSRDVDTLTSQQLRLKIPNAEIAFVIRSRFLHYYEKELGLGDEALFAYRLIWRSSFDKFVRSNELTSVKLQKAFDEYLDLPQSYLKGILSEDEDPTPQESLNRMLTYLLIDINCIRKEEIIFTPVLPATDALIVFTNRTVIVSMQYKRKSAELVCNEAKQHIKLVHQRNYPMNEIKIIGINIFGNSTTRISSILIT